MTKWQDFKDESDFEEKLDDILNNYNSFNCIILFLENYGILKIREKNSVILYMKYLEIKSIYL